VGPKIYTEDTHKINQTRIDRDALEIIYKLKSAGHTAYLVGGGVRDLLLGHIPKDYDISTSAKPEEIKHLFGKRCILIGKRFRLAHIRAGEKIFEVSTFRAGESETSSLIVRDNRWGTPEEDVVRRDFTINALFYDPTTHSVLDYVGGYPDIEKHLLRTIGEPHLRFKQDPVRMIRLLKFHARFGFLIEPKSESALHACKEEILKSAPARVLEEIFKMLESGAASSFFSLMHSFQFLETLFPCFHHFFEAHEPKVAFSYLQAIDLLQKKERILLDRAVLLTALVFPILEQELAILSQDRQMALAFSDIVSLSQSLFKGITISSFAAFPRKLISNAHMISVLQYRLTPANNRPRFSMKFPSHEDYFLAMQFLKVRSTVDHSLKELYMEWKKSKE
jgi:poly(A) polymerase